jgi:hypothetical protein
MRHGQLRRGLTGIAAGALVLAGIGAAGPAAAAAPKPGTLSTVIGGPGGPGPAGNVSMTPAGLKFAGGALYIAAEDAVYRVRPDTGWLTPVVAGNAISNDSPLPGASAVTVDRTGNLLIADGGQVLVLAAKTGTYYRRAMTKGHLYPVAYGLGDAQSVELDPAGNLVVACQGVEGSRTTDEIDSLVRVVAERSGTFYGRSMTAGQTYVVAGTQANGVLGDGIPAVKADLGIFLGTVRPDGAGNLIIADPGGSGGPQGPGPVTPSSAVRVVAGQTGTYYGQRMRAGHIYTIAGGVDKAPATGVPARTAGLEIANSVALDRAGNVVIADGGRVRVVAKATGTFYGRRMRGGYIYAIAGAADTDGGFAGDGGPAAKATFAAGRVAVDSAGNVLVTDTPNFLTDLQNYRVLMIAVKGGRFYGRTARAGYLYSVAGNGRMFPYSGDGGPATSAELEPFGLGTGGPGRLTVVDDATSDVVRAVPGVTGTYFGRPMRAGYIYTLAGHPAAGYSGDGGPAVKASLRFPETVAVDAAGDIVTDDQFARRVRMIAARSGTYFGRPMTAGDIYTIAGNGNDAYSGDGGPATAAGLFASIVAADRAGNLLIADDENNRLRVVAVKTGTYYGRPMTAGHIYTIAGTGSPAYSGDGAPGTATACQPTGVAADPAGNVLITDEFNHLVLLLAAKTGTAYGRHVTAGDMYTIAGNGQDTNAGDGGPATAAGIANNRFVVVGPDGFAVSDAGPVRLVAEHDGTFFGQRMKAGDIYTIADSITTGLAMTSTGDLLFSTFDRVLSLAR